MGRHLGIDFLATLVDFGSQVGVENRTKIDSKSYRKSEEKKRVFAMSLLCLCYVLCYVLLSFAMSLLGPKT